MGEIQRDASPIRFGIFEVDLRGGELRRQGVKVKLQDQPFQVLLMLLERPGEVVAREDFQKRLWEADTFVDFERGLNRAMNKLREALLDDSDSPRFIETLPRRGYRFLVPVEQVAMQTLVATLPVASVGDAKPGRAGHGRQLLPWMVCGALGVFAVIALWRPWRVPEGAADRPFLQFDLDAGSDGLAQPAISTDGMRIVFVTKGGLGIRRLDQSKVSPLAGTAGATLPFFSPDGRWIGFFAGGKLLKVAVEGGAPMALCDASAAGGGTWGDDDQIVAALNVSDGLFRIPAAGGAPERLTNSKADPAGVLMHFWPQALPGGKGILFAAVSGSFQGSLRILTPDGKIRTLMDNAIYGRVLAGGYLVYAQRGTLFAAPMDIRRLELSSPGVPLVYGVTTIGIGRAEFDASASGALVYRGGTRGLNSTASWVYHSGKVEPALQLADDYSTPRLSPEGKRLAVSVNREGRQSLWIYDLVRETSSRLTADTATELLPTWSPDGEYVVFRSGNALAWTRSDGSGPVERLAGVSPDSGPWSFSRDGKWLAFWPIQPDSDLWIVPVERAQGSLRVGQPRTLLDQAGSNGAPAISPDDRWLAYTSNTSGRFEVYVIPFTPEGGASRKWTVSNAGGWAPVWSRNGRELFYEDGNHRVQVSRYTVKGDTFLPEKPHAWSDAPLADSTGFAGYDVAADGDRVLELIRVEDPKTRSLMHVMLHVDSELRRRAAPQRN